MEFETRELALRTREFIDRVVIPAEGRPEAGRREKLRQQALAYGVFAPTAPREYDGLALSHRGMAVVLEEAGRSILGPVAMNCAAPDEGNILLLDKTATPTQRERYLEPLSRGSVRSCFAMTEPAPGAGSDPGQLMTTAEPADGGWRISGRKWFTTGFDGAAFAIVMARTGDGAATMFRLTHCMRWLGAARRCHETAVAYATGRTMFGSRPADLGMVQHALADNEIDIAASRALIWQAADELDQARPARSLTSMAKTFVAEATFRIADRSMQICGGSGIASDGPIRRLFNEIRPFRIYDGPSEVHRWSIARRAVRRFEAGQLPGDWATV